MTDTTDKERDLKLAENSLKQSCLRLTKYQHRATVDIKDVELVLTALEAERQRADKVEIKYTEVSIWYVKMKTRMLKAEAEVAGMKGDQVPVALVDERQGSGGFCLTQYGRRLNLQHGTELFTALQKHVPVGWEVCSPEWCNKHNACHEAPRFWFESEDGTGQHYHPSEYTASQKQNVMAGNEDCQSCDRHYVDGMKAGWNFHEEGDNQGFIDSIERVQKDMREARKEQVKNDA